MLQLGFEYYSAREVKVEDEVLHQIVDRIGTRIETLPTDEQKSYAYLSEHLKNRIGEEIVLRKTMCDIDFTLLTDTRRKHIGHYYLASLEAMRPFERKNLCLNVQYVKPGFMQCTNDDCDTILWEKIDIDHSNVDVVIASSHIFKKRKDRVAGHAREWAAQITTSNNPSVRTIQHEMLHLYTLDDEYTYPFKEPILHCKTLGNYVNVETVPTGTKPIEKTYPINACDQYPGIDSFRLVESETIMGIQSFHIPDEYIDIISPYVNDSSYFKGKVSREIDYYHSNR